MIFMGRQAGSGAVGAHAGHSLRTSGGGAPAIAAFISRAVTSPRSWPQPLQARLVVMRVDLRPCSS